jgi:hypothetical protein
MSSPLDINFSTQQLHFVAEYRELCAAVESLPHGKDYGSHASHTLPCYQFEDFDLLSGVCLNDAGA